MDIRPLHDRVVVKRIEEGETMQGGLYIPDSAKEKPQQGEVVALLRLFLGRIRDEESTVHGLTFFDPFNHDAVVKRTNIHT